MNLSEVPVAHTFRQRLVGLMGRRDDLSLLIPRCSSVHTFFMRSPIDIVFLDAQGVALKVVTRAAPWRVFYGPRGTDSVLELPPGTWSAAAMAPAPLTNP
jgi:uncharacterized membrane protein (UPF0127 family)